MHQGQSASFQLFFGRSSNGRTTASDAVYLGSNPSLPAKIEPALVAGFYFGRGTGDEPRSTICLEQNWTAAGWPRAAGFGPWRGQTILHFQPPRTRYQHPVSTHFTQRNVALRLRFDFASLRSGRTVAGSSYIGNSRRQQIVSQGLASSVPGPASVKFPLSISRQTDDLRN